MRTSIALIAGAILVFAGVATGEDSDADFRSAMDVAIDLDAIPDEIVV